MVDALRGFALLGIVLFHNLEHFNFYNETPFNPEWAKALDGYVWDFLALIFSGKAYSIFSILFGFSFWVQYSNQKARGNHFAGRFAWRMVLLICFGTFHSLFYNGDILSMYALLGFVLILTRKWSNKAVLILAFLCILQPIDWIKLLMALQDPNWKMAHPSWVYSAELHDARVNGSYLTMVWKNFTYGQLSNFCWIWNYGRLCQATGLFLLGMTLARKQMFSDVKPAFWIKTLILSIPASYILGWFKGYMVTNVITGGHAELAEIILNLYICVPQTLILLSILILAWHYSSYLRKALGWLAPYGRTSLTNYITQSIVGTYICFGYGFGLYEYCGATLSAIVGIIIVTTQVLISHWWLHRYKQGPFEWLWKQATWLGSKRKPKTLVTPEEEKG
jgi:uncharacterized protein